LIVNTASQCGFTFFTFQYEDLQRLYNRYKDQSFIILGFPCTQFADQESDGHEKIHSFCKPVKRYEATTDPLDIKKDIELL